MAGGIESKKECNNEGTCWTEEVLNIAVKKATLINPHGIEIM